MNQRRKNSMSNMMIWVPVMGIVALIYSFWRTGWIGKQDEGSDAMKAIGGHIADGAMAFLAREYRVLAIFVIK
jgi:K(+)-stimulated pyrophosphate-energized sodium pump